MKKKFLALLCTLCFCVTNFVVLVNTPVAAADVLKASMEINNSTRPTYSGFVGISGMSGQATTLGKSGTSPNQKYRVLSAVGSNKYFVPLDVDDSVLYNLNDHRRFKIEVEYFDHYSSGFFELAYDAIDIDTGTNSTKYMPSQTVTNTCWSNLDEDGNRMKVTFGGTDTWITATFYVDNARFANRLQGRYDLRLAGYSPTDGKSSYNFFVHSVKIYQADFTGTVYSATTLQPSNSTRGNIFYSSYNPPNGTSDTIEFYHTVTTGTYVISRYVCSLIEEESGEALVTHTQIETFKKASGATYTLHVPYPPKFGFYTLHVDVESYPMWDQSGTHTTTTTFTDRISVCYQTANTSDYLGFNEHIIRDNTMNMSNVGNLIRRSGTVTTRQSLMWSSFEQAKGDYRFTNPSAVENRMRAFTQALGTTPAGNSATIDASDMLLCLTGRSTLYCGTVTVNGKEYIEAPHTAMQIAAFAKYCGEAAYYMNTYCGITNFEIYNEWNVRTYNIGILSNAKVPVYAILLAAAAKEIKAKVPSATVVGGCFAGDTEATKNLETVLKSLNSYKTDSTLANLFDDSFATEYNTTYSLSDGADYATELQTFIRNNYPCMDVFSFHEYPDATISYPVQTFAQTGTKMQALMTKYIGHTIPIWLTEFGFSTASGETIVPADRAVYTEEEQLNHLVMTYAISKAQRADFAKVFMYNLYAADATTDNSYHKNYVEENYGIVRRWDQGNSTEDPWIYGEAKPAYLAIAAMQYLIGINTTKQNVNNSIVQNGDSYMFLFTNNTRRVALVMRSDKNCETETINFGVNSINVYDKYANLVGTLTSNNGQYNIVVTPEPKYYTGTSSNLSAAAFVDAASNAASYGVTLSATVRTSDGHILVNGSTGVDGDFVTVCVTPANADLSNNPTIKYVTQLTADEGGNFNVEIDKGSANLVGEHYWIWASSQAASQKAVAAGNTYTPHHIDFMFAWAKGAAVLRGQEELTSMTTVKPGDTLTARVAGVDVSSASNVKMIIAQYHLTTVNATTVPKLVAVKVVPISGDLRYIGSEALQDFRVEENVDRIKVFCWSFPNIVTPEDVTPCVLN